MRKDFYTIKNGQPVKIPAGNEAIQYEKEGELWNLPKQALELWSEASLEAVGVYTVTPASPPANRVITSRNVSWNGSKVLESVVTAPKPLAPTKREQMRARTSQPEIEGIIALLADMRGETVSQTLNAIEDLL
jgi:hypothetical protein